MEAEHEYFTPWSPLMQLSAAPAIDFSDVATAWGRNVKNSKRSDDVGKERWKQSWVDK